MTSARAMLSESGHAAAVLGAFAAGLHFDALPKGVVAAVRDCILDTVGACIGGADQMHSRMALSYVSDLEAPGRSVVLDGTGATTNAPTAAFANGLLSHATEYDCLRRPGAGVHGASVVAAALAAAQHLDRSGADLIAAVAAGIEVMFRIGRATHHSCEARGFHAPGLTGPFGAAVAVGHLLRLDAERMTRALGIAGSMASGLLEFAHSGDGSMVKKMHLGRAPESGVVAAMLAAKGFTGPVSVLDGSFGFLSVFCEESEPAALTAGLGSEFEAEKLCFKRFPCHITAHAPVQAILSLKLKAAIDHKQISAIRISASEKATKLHNITRPTDMGLAQYSIPFCVAVALAGDPFNPSSYDVAALSNPDLLRLADSVTMSAFQAGHARKSWAASLAVEMSDGTIHAIDVDDWPGTPTQPFDAAMRSDKFMTLTQRLLQRSAQPTYERLETLESEVGLGWLGRPIA